MRSEAPDPRLFKTARELGAGAIGPHRERASDPAVKRLLAYFEDHLFDADLTVGKAARELRLTEKTWRRFKEEVGRLPKEYLVQERLKATRWLVRETDVALWRIARFAGYSGAQNFSAVYRRQFGRSPSEDRQQAPRPAQPLSAVTGTGTQAPAGQIPARQEPNAGPPADEAPPCDLFGKFFIRKGSAGRRWAELFWQHLNEQPRDVQKDRLCSTVVAESPVVFDLLAEKSLAESRKNSVRAIEVAELALASVEASSPWLGDSACELRAIAWARLANAHGLAADLATAEAAFSRAEQEWATPRETHDLSVEAEIVSLKANQRLCQRRYPEAGELLDRAITLAQENGDGVLLIRLLLQRATLADYLNRHQDAVADLRTASKLVDEQDQPFLALAIQANLAASFAWAGNHEQALEILPQAHALAHQIDSHLVRHQLQWIEGMARLSGNDLSGAERLFREARAGLIEIEELPYAALVSLNLAMVLDGEDHSSEIASLASEALPILKALDFPEALSAVKLLSVAIEKNDVNAEVLSIAATCLSKMFRKPKKGLCLMSGKKEGRALPDPPR